MKVTNRFISIPPYISTEWGNVEAMHVQENLLLITLHDGQQVRVPHLSTEQIAFIFNAHSCFMETEHQLMDEMEEECEKQAHAAKNGEENAVISMQIGGVFTASDLGLTNIPGVMGISLQHNPRLSQSPNLPKEIIERITAIVKMVGGDNLEMITDSHPHCNCPFCQITNAIKQAHQNLPKDHIDKEELEVTEEELRFNQWEIESLEENLFSVKNKLDHDETYKVCLQPKLACTCGQEGCEHIIAVLKT